jgi:hypothetical protein
MSRVGKRLFCKTRAYAKLPSALSGNVLNRLPNGNKEKKIWATKTKLNILKYIEHFIYGQLKTGVVLYKYGFITLYDEQFVRL